jgi:hypothetical protein
MTRLGSILGYSAAALTLAFAAAVPFLLDPVERAIGTTGLRIDPIYSGGDVARVIDRGAYRIEVHRPVHRRWPTQHIDPFVQMVWTPADRLPARVADDVDVDGDGVPDLLVSFDPAKLDLAVTPRSAAFRPYRGAGVGSFAALIARVNNGIVVRAPLK